MTQTVDEPRAAQSPNATTATSHRDATVGLLYGIAAYSFWGIVAAYFKLLAHVPPLVVLSNRIAWSAIGRTAAMNRPSGEWTAIR